MPRTTSQIRSDKRMTKAGYKLIAVWFPKADAKKAEKLAKRETISASAVIRRALRELLEKLDTQNKSG